MSDVSDKVDIKYHFVVDKGSITNKHKRDVPAILAVDASLSIRINGELYFETELAILEFYGALHSWKKEITEQ